MKKINPLIYVVIPNKDGIQHLEYSLKSLASSTYRNFRVVLVDNGSIDESLSYVAENYKDITILHNSGKKGFAGGVNTGIRYALEKNAEFIAVFSNDIQVLPAWIELALSIFETSDRIGLVGFTEVLKENEELFYSSRIDASTVMHKKVERLAGCLYLCSEKLFRSIGYFDEDYYMYGEDNDLFARILKANFLIIETTIPVWHYGEGFSQNNKLMPTWLAYRNALRFSIKNKSLGGIFKMLLSLFNLGCNPFLSPRPFDPVYKRMRRYNIFVNFLLILGSCAWNLMSLGATLKARFMQKRLNKFSSQMKM